MSDFHSIEKIGSACNSLYTSDVKFGYEKKPHRFQYRVNGEKLGWAQIRELVPATINDRTLSGRLGSKFETTIEWLSRPTAGNSRRAAGRVYDQHRRQSRRAAIVAADKKAYLARKADCHVKIYK